MNEFSNKNFVHLHNHSEYSTFDGLSPVKNMAAYARLQGFPALALTDHGNVGGILKHMKYCTAPYLEYVDDKGNKHDSGAPIKPIVGIEYYFTKDHRNKGENFHLTALAKNYQGYRNLCMLSDKAYRDGFYKKPRIDFDLLFKHKEGLIVTTGCPSSIVNANLLRGRYNQASSIVGMMKEVFGEDFYVEIMYHGLKMEKLIIKDQIKLAREHGIPIVATNDNHCVEKQHSKSHDVFLSMNSKTCIKDPKRMTFSYPEFYIKSGQEMYDIWREVPEALMNTCAVAEKVDSKEIMDNLYGGMKMPNFPVPKKYEINKDGLSEKEKMFKESFSYLEELSKEGLKNLGWDKSDKHIKALEQELSDINVAWTSNRYDFATYMLIVWDIIKWAKDNDVMIAAGRGSGYASVLLRTLNICYGPDPLEYGLLWERFLGFDDIRFVSSIDFGLEITNKSIKTPEKSEIIKEIRKAILDKFSSKEEVERWKLEMQEMSSTEGLNQQNNLKAFYFTWKGVEEQTGDDNRINSLTAFLLGITTLKPDINSEFMPCRRAFARAGFPDIDTDIDDENRDKIFEYAIQKYGEECVANIGTYSTLKLRSAVTRTIKALDIADAFHKGPEHFKTDNLSMVNEILGGLPNGADVKVYDSGGVKKLKTIKECKEYFKHFKYYMDKYPDIEYHCNNIQGLLSSFSVHAAGLVIANEPIGYIAPVRPAKEKVISSDNGDITQKKSFTTQYDYPDLESIGLIKFDFLGIATLSVISNTKKLIKENYGFDLDVEKIPVTDQKTLDLYNTGKLSGVFQCENNGMQQTMMEVGVDSFKDVMAIISLYRPGPMDNIPAYSSIKKGLKKPDYFHKSIQEFIEPYLKDTYSILCYQEGTKVIMEDGSYKKIEDVKKGDIVLSVNQDKKIEAQPCDGNAFVGEKECFEILLENGMSLSVTKDHKIMTEKGMKKLEDISLKNDYIAVPDNLNLDVNSQNLTGLDLFLKDKLSTAYLVGVLIGDGSVTQSVSICCGPEDNCNKLMKFLEEKFPMLISRKYFHCRSWYISVFGKETVEEYAEKGVGNRKTKFKYELDKIGLNKNCYNKRIPKEYFSKSLEEKSFLLAGLIDSDGCIFSKNNKIRQINIKSINNDLLDDIEILCQGMRIVTTKSHKNNLILLNNHTHIKKLINDKLVLKNLDNVSLKAELCGVVGFDRIANLVTEESIGKFCNKRGINDSNILRAKKRGFVSSGLAKRIGINDNDIRYYRIKEINSVGIKRTWDMSVRKNHNLIANGIVASNCYQEQIMQVLQSIAGFSSTEGYMMIKAVGKKKPELMPPIESKFLSGAVHKGVPKSVAKEYWHEILMPFADYGFNASHACGYGYVSFQTAYLKANYPEEFFCALLNSINVRKDFDKMAIVESDLKNFNIKLRENDINLSNVGYNVIKKKNIKDGIIQSEIAPSLMCKGVGKKPAQDIANNKPYANLRDLALKTNSKIVNSGAISSLHEHKYLDSILDAKQKRLKREDLILEFNEARNAIKKAKKKGIDPSEGIF